MVLTLQTMNEINDAHFFIWRFAIMSSCWEKEQKNRPNFEELRSELRGLLEENDVSSFS